MRLTLYRTVHSHRTRFVHLSLGVISGFVLLLIALARPRCQNPFTWDLHLVLSLSFQLCPFLPKCREFRYAQFSAFVLHHFESVRCLLKMDKFPSTTRIWFSEVHRCQITIEFVTNFGCLSQVIPGSELGLLDFGGYSN
jgi:hypothetical protein